MEIHDSEMAGLQNEQYLFKLHFGGLQDVGLRQRKRQRQGAFKEHRSDVQTSREAARRELRQSCSPIWKGVGRVEAAATAAGKAAALSCLQHSPSLWICCHQHHCPTSSRLKLSMSVVCSIPR